MGKTGDMMEDIAEVLITEEEIKAKTIDGDNLEMNCPECMEVHKANIRSVCPEYAEECHL